MALCTAAFGGEKGLHQLPGKGMSHDEATKAHHVQIVVLDALMRRKGLMDQTGANSHDFVCRDRRPNTTSTDAYPSIHVSRGNGAGERHNEIRIIVVDFGLPVAEIDYFVTGLTQPSGSPKDRKSTRLNSSHRS